MEESIKMGVAFLQGFTWGQWIIAVFIILATIIGFLDSLVLLTPTKTDDLWWGKVKKTKTARIILKILAMIGKLAGSKNHLWLFLLVPVSMACASINYSNDKQYMSPDRGNVYSWPFGVQGHMCPAGHCVVQVRKDASKIYFRLLPENYNYRFHLVCAYPLAIDLTVTVTKKKPYTFSIQKSHYESIRAFGCIGSAEPIDSNRKFLKQFYIHIKLINAGYLFSSIPYLIKKKTPILKKIRNYLVLGQFAYGTLLNIDGKRIWLKKKTLYKMPEKFKTVCVRTETYNMRQKLVCLNKI